MKRIILGLLIVLAAIPIVGSFVYLYNKSRSARVVYATEVAQIRDITKKTVATGSVVPRQAVEVKPKLTGVLSELYVVAGNLVKKGDAIGKIQIIPDAQTVQAAESAVRTAQIAVENAKRELAREEALFKQGVVSEAELYKFRTDYALAKTQAENAGSNLQLVKSGARGSEKQSNVIVTATVDGMVIDVPVKVGYSVIQANSFNPGTTIATIANMSDMIFEGRVDESEIGKIQEGMKLAIKVGAIDGEFFEGRLEFIAPQGKEIEGAIQFAIRAAITQKPGRVIRAGYSANADIVLDERTQVLAIREAVVHYDRDDATKPYVEVETAPQRFVRRDVKLGLSDGVNVELKSGVTATDRLKVPDNAGPAGIGTASATGNTKTPSRAAKH
jgi:HlyD family secretion protein